MKAQVAIGAPAVLGSVPSWRAHEIPARVETRLRKTQSVAMLYKIPSLMVREPAAMSDLAAGT